MSISAQERNDQQHWLGLANKRGEGGERIRVSRQKGYNDAVASHKIGVGRRFLRQAWEL